MPFLDRAWARGVEHVVFLSVAKADTNRWVPHHAVAETIDPTLQTLLGRRPRTMDDYVRDHAPLWRSPSV